MLNDVLVSKNSKGSLFVKPAARRVDCIQLVCWQSLFVNPN